MEVRSFGLTDVGRRRQTNEDDLLLEPAHRLFAVADGMGGHAAGEIAARLAIETLHDTLARVAPGQPYGSIAEVGERLVAAVTEANRRICESIDCHEERRGMGTTVVALSYLDDDAVIGHVGDSRLYLLRRSELQRMTSDHSWVNEQVKLGLMSDDMAQRHPMRNIVTRALGSRSDVAVDVSTVRIEPGDLFLLCSDGLNTMLTDVEIEHSLKAHRNDPEGACHALVAAANDRGGEDNVTVIAVLFGGVAAKSSPRKNA